MKKIAYDSPIYAGISILELYKLHMYDVFFMKSNTITKGITTTLHGY